MAVACAVVCRAACASILGIEEMLIGFPPEQMAAMATLLMVSLSGHLPC